jgi:hypothetical protein
MATRIIKSKIKKNPALLVAACGMLLLFLGCEKQSNAPAHPNDAPVELTAQEQKLLGKWQLVRNDVYEIIGVDSMGGYLCVLIGSAACDSPCVMELTARPAVAGQLKGSGTPGGCDAAPFSWQARQPCELVANGQTYQVLYLAQDSAVLSAYCVKDVLKLKTVLHFKR